MLYLKIKQILDLGDANIDGTDFIACTRGVLTGNLAGHGVGLADLVTPETSPHRDDGKLGKDDGSTNCGGHFLRALPGKKINN
jgi:hypothetical protein